MNKSPIEKYDTSDPGDEMQLRLRYQHGYGLILFCAAEVGQLDCKSLWFEQHEDILLEKNNGRFNFYQIKTREATLGKWKITDEALFKSVRRFCEFENKYGELIDEFLFVSNCQYRESKEGTKEEDKALSPINFFRYAKSGAKFDGEFKNRLDDLVNAVGIGEEIVLQAIKKISLVVGPPLENFEIDLSATHLISIPHLKDMSLTHINRMRDEFLYKVFQASSLSINDAHKHIFCRLGDKKYDPRILSKKIELEEFSLLIKSVPKQVFMYFENSAELEIGTSLKDMGVLKKKMDRAGLGSQYESLKRRALSAEELFLEEVNKNPENFQTMLDQVEGTVLTTCSDAILDATNGNKIDGVEAFKSARKQLENFSENNPAQVACKNVDCLIGVAGLLTGACKLWWSEEFDLGDEA